MSDVKIYGILSTSIVVSKVIVLNTALLNSNQQKNDVHFDGHIMNWVLLSFAVITPMSKSISMAFARRDEALFHIADIKTTLWNLYSAHACWDWSNARKPNSGRAGCNIDWQDHGDHVLEAIVLMCQDLTRMLTLPNGSRARHRATGCGAVEAKKIMAVRLKLHRSIYRRQNMLTSLCEVFKDQGLPPNEATRIRQWERMVTQRIGKLERSHHC